MQHKIQPGSVKRILVILLFDDVSGLLFSLVSLKVLGPFASFQIFYRSMYLEKARLSEVISMND